MKGQGVTDKLRLVKKLLQHYNKKLINHFVVITDKKIRFIPLEDIK